MVLYDLDNQIDESVVLKLKEIAEKAEQNAYQFIILNSTSQNKIDEFIEKYGFQNFSFYNCDDIDLKTIIRSNPGLIVVKDAIVKSKYHYKNLKPFDEIMSSIN